jgi:DNA-binding MarR family transcriptional regulator
MRKRRYIELTKTETEQLEKELKLPHSRQEIVRIEGLLLSFRQYEIKEIVAILKVNRDTVSRWITNFEKRKLLSIYNFPKSGRRKIFTDSDEKKY